ncbi:MAG TPA: DUF1552 domain-containing protein [Polyangia bacterium]
MKLVSRRDVRRRDLIKWLGGAALALPAGLELFQRTARADAAATIARYAVFCYTPDGVNQGEFWPAATSDTDFQLSSILSPFAPYKDKMLILGPQMAGNVPMNGTGLTYCLCGGTTNADVIPPQHQAPITLTARARGTSGDFQYIDQNTTVNRLDGPSIDTVIGAAVQKDSTFANLNFGIHPIGGDTPSDINYANDGTPLKRMASASEAWSLVFGQPLMNTGAASATLELDRQTALSNYLHKRFAALSPQLGTYDRQLLDGHLTALRTYEDRKTKMLMGTGNACMPPMNMPSNVPSDDTAVRTGADVEKLSPFYMDMIAAAFSCNLTKVASVTFGYPGGGDAGGLRMPWLGFTDPLHGVSHHGGDPTKLDKYKQMNTWIAGQVAYLMQNLAAIPDPATGKTLLDATIIYWFNRHGDGDAHTNTNLPNVILGGTGGYFKMGRFLQLPSTNPTKVLISIANSMGVDVPTFGKDAWIDTAPLSGLTA